MEQNENNIIFSIKVYGKIKEYRELVYNFLLDEIYEKKICIKNMNNKKFDKDSIIKDNHIILCFGYDKPGSLDALKEMLYSIMINKQQSKEIHVMIV